MTSVYDTLCVSSAPPGGLRNRAVQAQVLRWHGHADSHALTCYVVEPPAYDPPAHAALVTEIVTASLAPPGRGGAVEGRRRGLKTFDMMTFPEAFMPAAALLQLLSHIQGEQRSSLFHVGLRPNVEGTHLFTVTELRDLASEIANLGPSAAADVGEFQAWVAQQDSDNFFNIACVFMIDAERQLRVCLHPKNTPSTMELSALADHTVAHTDFVTVIALVPADDRADPIHIQPLICSDLPDLATSSAGLGPMQVVSQGGERFGDGAPAKIDIVSVATCTPQVDRSDSLQSGPDLWWHQQFRSALVDTLSRQALRRHRDAVVVLSNVREGPDGGAAGEAAVRRPYGLSGVFAPGAPFRDKIRSVCVFGWGRPNGKADDQWRRVDQADASPSIDKAQLVTIDSQDGEATGRARLIRVIVPRLPGNQPQAVPLKLTSVEVLVWSPDVFAAKPEIVEITNV